MTDKELMQQALMALEEWLTSKQWRDLINALREWLAQPEQEPVAYTTGHCEHHKQKGGCQLHNLQCGWPDCDRKPISTPRQMQPCAGRNCGSTNPNLHSAECFEDYDKATGADSNRTWTQAHWTEYEHSIAAAEREAIAQSLDKQADLACDEIDRQWAQEMAAAVRARGDKT